MHHEYPFSIPPPMDKRVSECHTCTGQIRLEDGSGGSRPSLRVAPFMDAMLRSLESRS